MKNFEALFACLIVFVMMAVVVSAMVTGQALTINEQMMAGGIAVLFGLYSKSQKHTQISQPIAG